MPVSQKCLACGFASDERCGHSEDGQHIFVDADVYWRYYRSQPHEYPLEVPHSPLSVRKDRDTLQSYRAILAPLRKQIRGRHGLRWEDVGVVLAALDILDRAEKDHQPIVWTDMVREAYTVAVVAKPA